MNKMIKVTVLFSYSLVHDHKLRVLAMHKDKIIIIEGDTIKSHEYIIPKSKADHYDENDLYLNISRRDMILNFEL